jgi:hypothetical protein
MKFEWNEDKRQANIHKHNIDFVDVPAVFDGDVVFIEDDRFDYGETRFVTFGLLKGRVVAIVHVAHGDVTRIISARKVTKNEEKNYFEQIAN